MALSYVKMGTWSGPFSYVRALNSLDSHLIEWMTVFITDLILHFNNALCYTDTRVHTHIYS